MPAPTLTTVRPGVRFIPAAAASFVRLEDAVDRKVDVNSSYRDWDLQLRWHKESVAYRNGTGPYPGHSYAVHPDNSDHTKGIGLDSDDWKTPGFNVIAADHGWIRTAASDPTERHHFQYQAARDNHRNRPAGSSGTDISGEDDMQLTDLFDVTQPDGSKQKVYVAQLFDILYQRGNQNQNLLNDIKAEVGDDLELTDVFEVTQPDGSKQKVYVSQLLDILYQRGNQIKAEIEAGGTGGGGGGGVTITKEQLVEALKDPSVVAAHAAAFVAEMKKPGN